MLTEQCSIEDGKYLIKSEETKTTAGMREIDLPKKAVDIYEELLNLNTDSGSTFLFATSKGTPIQITAINTYLRWLKEKTDIDKPLSTHIFRHTHISKLAEIGTPLFAIQDRVGHENSRITESIYLHVTKGVKDKLKKDIELL
ncbi:tyrosine-type recombinase/integrase [Enterococcus sp. DIV0212c]|uniref:tyrosine-type recombinase/integrase n=1 Tax=Enterococcus sp. DIV0212c TaxID=2230867 RepID=UPI00325C2AE1